MIHLTCLILSLLAPVRGQQASFTRAEIEAFLSNARIVNQRETSGLVLVTLDDGKRKHDANLVTPDRNREGDIYENVAAYELDKALGLNMVVPAVERMVDGQRAVVIWWADNVAMMEIDRQRRNIQPPDPVSWSRQRLAVRLFDELISNGWPRTQELLITRDWRIHLIDHRMTFWNNRLLEHPETLTQCDRTVLANLRRLNREAFGQMLGKYEPNDQLDALENRRQLLVKHFDALIASKGEAAVLYDLPTRP